MKNRTITLVLGFWIASALVFKSAAHAQDFEPVSINRAQIARELMSLVGTYHKPFDDGGDTLATVIVDPPSNQAPYIRAAYITSIGSVLQILTIPVDSINEMPDVSHFSAGFEKGKTQVESIYKNNELVQTSTVEFSTTGLYSNRKSVTTTTLRLVGDVLELHHTRNHYKKKYEAYGPWVTDEDSHLQKTDRLGLHLLFTRISSNPMSMEALKTIAQRVRAQFEARSKAKQKKAQIIDFSEYRGLKGSNPCGDALKE